MPRPLPYFVLDRVVVLVQPTYEEERSRWNNLVPADPIEHEVWAMRRDLSARERVTERLGVLSTLRSRFIVRFRDDIKATWRLRDGSERFNIEGTRELGRRKFLELICSSHQGGA